MREQADRFGLPAEEYLKAWRQVPVFDPEKVRQARSFHRCCIHLLAQMGEDRLGRRKIEKELEEREQRLRRQNAELLRLGKLRGISFGQFAAVAREILEATARVLEVERVSLWLYNRERTRLRCFDQFECSRRRHSRGEELQTGWYPHYFTLIGKGSNLVVDDVSRDPRTRELWETYLQPAGISSMLDTPVWSGGRMVGILCCEHIGAPRRWSYDEQNFAGSAADFLSLTREERDCRWAEAGLRESEEKYRLLFSSESDAILICDVESRRILEVNPAATLLYGYSREEFSKLGIDDISAEPALSHARIDQMLSGGHLSRVPLSHHRRRDGLVFPVEISSGAFVWKGRRRFAAIVRDITEREKAAEMKEEVLSVVSHEMRTPLTAMIGFTEFLLENEVGEAQRSEYLQIIHREGERLQDLTDNLLDLQRLRAGVDAGNYQPVGVFPLLLSAARLFSKASASHNIVLDCPENLPPAWGDEKQLYRSLQNLLSNAIKYSPEGGEIILGARRAGDFAVIWVRDRGIGIPPNAHDLIFERFSRGSSSAVKTDQRHRSGAGAGAGDSRDPSRPGLGEERPWRGEHFLPGYPSAAERQAEQRGNGPWPAAWGSLRRRSGRGRIKGRAGFSIDGRWSRQRGGLPNPQARWRAPSASRRGLPPGVPPGSGSVPAASDDRRTGGDRPAPPPAPG